MKLIAKYFNYLILLITSPKQYAKYKKVKIGFKCQISTKFWGTEPYLIEIGDHVHVTRGVRFINHDGAVWVFREQNSHFDVFGRIKIGNNTFIGNDSTILYGVSIGKNCIVGACSVVTKSIPDGFVVAGNPAKFICTTEEYYKKMLPYNTNFKDAKNKRLKLLQLDESFFIKRKYMRI